MDTNDTRSIISTLPQQQVIYLPVDQDATSAAAGPLAGQQQANASAVSALLMHKLGAGALGSVSSATEIPAAVLPLQAALPYGSGNAASEQSAAQSDSATGITLLPAGSGDTEAQEVNAATASRAEGAAAGTLLPAQAQQVDPVLNQEANNMTEADLHQSKGALEQQKETGITQPG